MSADDQISNNTARDAYFGDLHVHTAYSLDAQLVGAANTPDDAYEFGKGGSRPLYQGGPMMRLTAPLDFMAVTDHSEWMGEMGTILDKDFEPADEDAREMLAAQRAANMTEAGDYKLSMSVIMRGMVSPQPTHESFAQSGSDETRQHEQTIWRYMAETANKHNEPGRFTTFVGYEWSATPNAANLHRCVIFRGDDVPDSPLSYIDTQNPEELWDWMQGPGGGPENVLAIPHNSNMSQGLMFLPRYVDGRPIDRAYAEIRSLMEPLVEMHQIKGNSEANPALAMNDEFADFEQVHGGSAWGSKGVSTTAYVRDGLKEGLRQADRLGVNPFKYGFVGSTDTHTGLPGDTEEPDWGGHFPHQDTSAEARLQSASEEVISFIEENPGGLAGVWADANSRDVERGGCWNRVAGGLTGIRRFPRGALRRG